MKTRTGSRRIVPSAGDLDQHTLHARIDHLAQQLFLISFPEVGDGCQTETRASACEGRREHLRSRSEGTNKGLHMLDAHALIV